MALGLARQTVLVESSSNAGQPAFSSGKTDSDFMGNL
jgi:hypothetical protein